MTRWGIHALLVLGIGTSVAPPLAAQSRIGPAVVVRRGSTTPAASAVSRPDQASPSNAPRRLGAAKPVAAPDVPVAPRSLLVEAPVADPSEPIRFGPSSSVELPPDSVEWWHSAIVRPQRDGAPTVGLDLERLAIEALTHSEQIKSLRAAPWARAQAIGVAEAEFDPTAFVDSKFNDISVPVSDTLTTGGPSRLSEHRWDFDAGLRQKLASGAALSLSQQLGHKNSNSLFFVPNNQGSSQITLGLTQPLLRGQGACFNRSLIVLAELDTRVARDEFAREAQAQLLDVARTYWALYTERSSLLARHKHLARAEAVGRELAARRAVDATEIQVVRAQAAVARRQADLARSDAGVRNAETRLRALVNSPLLAEGAEFLPLQLPSGEPLAVDARKQVELALQHRPEIDAAFQQVRATGVRLDISRNELLPVLNMVVETYVRGIQGDSDVGVAWREQFTQGAPSYSAGLLFEYPLFNRAARSRLRQRQFELAQVTHALRSAMAQVAGEAENAVRNLHASQRQVVSQEQSVRATRAEVEQLEARWRLLAGDDRTASLALEDLLQAHERLLNEELSLVQYLAEYSLAAVELRRVTGTLVDVDAALCHNHENPCDPDIPPAQTPHGAPLAGTAALPPPPPASGRATLQERSANR